MNLQFQQYLPDGFAPASRVWIYQSNRLFTMAEALQVEEVLEKFTDNWLSHGAPVKGHANLLYGHFILLLADETRVPVGGCSTDSSVQVIRDIERLTGVSLFDRQQLAFIKNDKIELLPLAQLNYAVQNGFINGDTLYFNNTVLTREELEKKWIVPVKESWLAKRIGLAPVVTG